MKTLLSPIIKYEFFMCIFFLLSIYNLIISFYNLLQFSYQSTWKFMAHLDFFFFFFFLALIIIIIIRSFIIKLLTLRNNYLFIYLYIFFFFLAFFIWFFFFFLFLLERKFLVFWKRDFNVKIIIINFLFSLKTVFRNEIQIESSSSIRYNFTDVVTG